MEIQKTVESKWFRDHTTLLKDLSEGDEKAFGILFDHYYATLWPFVFKFTKSAADAEEVMQEIFVRVWLYRDRLTEVGHLDAWIYKVASRECLSFLRKRVSYSRPLTWQTLERDFPVWEGGSPLQSMQMDEIRSAIGNFVDRMPPQRKRIFQMSREEGMKPAEIARELSLSVSTVKNVLSLSLKEMREFLVKSGFDLTVAGFWWSLFWASV